MNKIQYPYALTSEGALKYIKFADKSEDYRCVTCHALMVCRQGVVNTWHFAHKSSDGERCNPDLSIHRQSQYLLRDALDRCRRIIFHFPCGICERYGLNAKQYMKDVIYKDKHTYDVVLEDRSIFNGAAIPDIVIYQNGKPMIIIEVVYTHPLEARTISIYQRSNIPVLCVKVDADWLLERQSILYEAFPVEALVQVYQVYNPTDAMLCGNCRNDPEKGYKYASDQRMKAGIICECGRPKKAGDYKCGSNHWELCQRCNIKYYYAPKYNMCSTCYYKTKADSYYVDRENQRNRIRS